MSDVKWTLTNESVTVIKDGVPVTFQEGTPNYASIRAAILANQIEDIDGYLTVASSIEKWAKGDFTVEGEFVFYKGEQLPCEFNQRILAFASEGKSPEPLFRFWERLKKNPSKRSVDQLWSFLNHIGIPIDDDGYFLAYKAVKQDWYDIYSGTVKNEIGAKVTYDRNKVSDDPREACHEGLHVGALSYAHQYGGSGCRMLICRVDPADVVCVPYDESARKMRVCAYEVIGQYAGLMPSTYIDSDDLPSKVEPDESYEQNEGYEAPEDDPYVRLDELDYADLLNESLDTLRKYAANHLKMVGASKVPGGKDALVRRILNLRD